MIDRKSISDLSIEMGYPVPSEECFALADKVISHLRSFGGLVTYDSCGDEEGAICIPFSFNGNPGVIDIDDDKTIWLSVNNWNTIELTDITSNWESVLRELFDN